MKRIIIFSILSFFILPGLTRADDLTRDTQTLLLKARDTVTHAERELAKKRSVNADFNTLKTLADDLRVNHLLLQDRFETRKQTVNTLGSQAVERHAAMLQQYTQVIEGLLNTLDALQSAKDLTLDKINKLKTLLENIAPKRPNPIYGALPYHHLNYASQAPQSGTTLVPAYLGGDKIVKNEDLADTSLAPISRTIAEKAQELNWNPALIYEWIKNNVQSEWYWGVQKGAEETLRQKSGNDADQACLFVALLRASGYPCRYVRGTMEFFPDLDRAKHLTGIRDEQQLLTFFRKAGIPAKAIISGGKIQNIQIEHIWVESQIPYANYRGAVIDTLGKTWLGLDTHIKNAGYEIKASKPWPETLDLSHIRDLYFSQTQPQAPLNYVQDYINAWLNQNQPGITYQDLLETRTLIPDVMKILPASLQIKEIAVTREYADLPDELIHQVGFKAYDQNNSVFFETTLPAWQLSNQKVTLTYEPESIEDQEIINSFGGLGNTPAYLVRLRPVIKVNGERTVIGEAGSAMGSDYVLDLEIISPNSTERISNTYIMGNLAVIGIVSRQALAPQEIPLEEQDAEYLLHKEALNYIQRWNQAEEELGSLFRIAVIRPIPTVVSLGGVIQVDYLLGQPHEFSFKGIYMDAALRAIELVPKVSPFTLQPSLFMTLSSLQGSVLEHKVIEEDFGIECISTAKLFGLINAQPANPQLINIDRTNINTILPTLTLLPNIKDDITNKVNQGFTVRTPQTEIAYEDWTGTGYLIEKPQTGESGYMLSGQIAGGMTVLRTNRWQYFFLDVLMHPYATAPNQDPNSAFYIMKLAASDLQTGTVGQPLRTPLQVVVLDRNRRPVQGAKVTFQVKAGGGRLGLDETISDYQGIAAVAFSLGKYTKDNPTYWQQREMAYSQQIGENIIDASLASGTRLKAPFTAYGFPKPAAKIVKTYGDNIESPILAFSGFLAVTITDEYDNPLANLPVDFIALPAQTKEDPCPIKNQDKRPAYFFNRFDPCGLRDPYWGQCGNTNDQQLQDITDSRGSAQVYVVLGGEPDAKYMFEARQAQINTPVTFEQHTRYFKNCAIDIPYFQAYLNGLITTDQYGNNIVAGKSGTTLPLYAKVYAILEKGKIISVTRECGSAPNTVTITCPYAQGIKQYDFVQPDSVSVKFGGQEGIEQSQGIYKYDYTLNPGMNSVGLSAVVKHKTNNYHIDCGMPHCWTDDFMWVNNLSTVPFTVYGIDIKIDPLPSAEVDNEGYLLSDYEIKYRINPAAYTAMNTQVFIYENDNFIAYLLGETSGQGHVTLARGFHVDINKKYEMEVVLNYGTGSEIRSDKVPLTFSHYDIHGKFKITNIETEMQEDYEPGERVLRTLGGMRIRLEAFLKPPLEVTEYEWSATSGTTFYSSYDTNAGILTGAALKGSNLKEIYWEGDNKVNQEAEIKLKITFKDSPEHIITKKIKTRVLSYLDNGDDVKMLQAFMRMMGISEIDTGYSGTPVTMDGNFTMRTEKALKAFQMADEVSKSGIADDALLARVRIHWVDYKKAIDTKPYPDHPKMNNTYSHAGYPGFNEWAQDAADYFQNQPYGTTMMNAIYPISGVTLVKAWIDQESSDGGQWGYENKKKGITLIPFRISLGGADEEGSIGFSQICNKWKYGAKPSNLIKDLNPYDPKENIEIFRVWAEDLGLNNAFIGNPPPYKKSKNYALPYFPILVATNNVPINNYYQDNDFECLLKGIMAYNCGSLSVPSYIWPEILRRYDCPPDSDTNWSNRHSIRYALRIKRDSEKRSSITLSNKIWTWKCQRINVGKNKICDTYIHPWDTQLIAFGSSSSPSSAVKKMKYSDTNRLRF